MFPEFQEISNSSIIPLHFSILLLLFLNISHHALQRDCCHDTYYALFTLTYSRESDAMHYRESFMEVMDEIED